ncbi:MAG: DUF4147 domain-containing protein [Planctomycetaceae bacterium]
MNRNSLRNDAVEIWRAGVEAVDSERLIADHLSLDHDSLTLCDERIPLADIERIAVVGAGKAGAGMAVAVEKALGELLLEKKVSGWVNVPADCIQPTRVIHLHPARPAGHNEPTEAGVEGTLEILRQVSELGPKDLCIVLLSGGGSALLPAPVEAISLSEKQAVTRFLMQAGASINELNCVRKQLSQVKGGRLARASRAGRTISLIISDVIGDPLDVIASGPTVADSSTPEEALKILQKYMHSAADVPANVIEYLSQLSVEKQSPDENEIGIVRNYVIGNNAVAVDAAARKAEELGYELAFRETDRSGIAREMGTELAERSLEIRNALEPGSKPRCLISGGEPVVQLVRTDRPRKGGRNQELVLSAVSTLWQDRMRGIVILSGGTDGEDGPTDAAGAVADEELIARAKERELSPESYLAINNSYPFFEQTGGLLKTGPTHTNVMDVRVVLVQAESD